MSCTRSLFGCRAMASILSKLDAAADTRTEPELVDHDCHDARAEWSPDAGPLTTLLLTVRSHTDLIEEVSRNVLAAPYIRRLADVIVSRLSAGGAASNGVHLRLEQDARFQTRTSGGEHVRAPLKHCSTSAQWAALLEHKWTHRDMSHVRTCCAHLVIAPMPASYSSVGLSDAVTQLPLQ